MAFFFLYLLIVLCISSHDYPEKDEFLGGHGLERDIPKVDILLYYMRVYTHIHTILGHQCILI